MYYYFFFFFYFNEADSDGYKFNCLQLTTITVNANNFIKYITGTCNIWDTFYVLVEDIANNKIIIINNLHVSIQKS